MNFITKPMEIENKSMEIIAPYLSELKISAEETKVFSRIIHAAGDVEYASVIKIHPEVIAAAQAALKSGCNVYTDVEMVRTGINKKKLASFGGKVECLIADEGVAATAKAEGITRSMAAMRAFGKKLDGAIVAIGNAPTALFEVMRLIEEEGIHPAAIIGVPVGFVGAAESKAVLAQKSPAPYITVEGTKGGSPIAVAALNAIMYLLDNRR
ncbi:MAG: precorrin-8X methylmutase [Selenomonadaceae bacterium]